MFSIDRHRSTSSSPENSRQTDNVGNMSARRWCWLPWTTRFDENRNRTSRVTRQRARCAVCRPLVAACYRGELENFKNFPNDKREDKMNRVVYGRCICRGSTRLPIVGRRFPIDRKTHCTFVAPRLYNPKTAGAASRRTGVWTTFSATCGRVAIVENYRTELVRCSSVRKSNESNDRPNLLTRHDKEWNVLLDVRVVDRFPRGVPPWWTNKGSVTEELWLHARTTFRKSNSKSKIIKTKFITCWVGFENLATRIRRPAEFVKEWLGKNVFLVVYVGTVWTGAGPG